MNNITTIEFSPFTLLLLPDYLLLNLAESLKGIKHDDGDFYYNFSKVFARNEKIKACLDYLGKAIELNAPLLVEIDEEKDFDDIRSNEEFQVLLDQFKH